MTDAARNLAETHVGSACAVARAMAHRYGMGWLADELESAALLWVCEAAVAYDPRFGTEPGLWLRWRVSLQAKNFLKGQRRRMADRLEGTELDRPGPDAGARLDYEYATRQLGPTRKQLIDLVLLEGLTPVEASRAVGLTRGTGFRLWRDTLRLITRLTRAG